MSETASVILTGEIMPGHVVADVIVALAKVLKTNEDKAASLLAGRETVIKREVPVAQVARYIEALSQTGAKARVQHERARADAFPEIVEPKLAPAPASAPVSTPAPAPTPEPDVDPLSILVAPHALEPEPTPAPAPFSGLSLVDGPAAPSPAKAAPAAGHEAVCPECGKGQAIRSMCRYCGADMGLARERRAPSPTYSAESIYAAPGSADWREQFSEETHTPPVFGVSTKGRIGRLRYLAYIWPVSLLAAVVGVLEALIVPKHATLGGVLMIPFGATILFMMVRLVAMRMHDFNRSGKWMLLMIVLPFVFMMMKSPILIGIWAICFVVSWFVLLLWPGTSGVNQYGPPPGPNTTLVIVGAALIILFQVINFVASYKYGAQNHLYHPGAGFGQQPAGRGFP